MPQTYSQRVYQEFTSSGVVDEDTLVKTGEGIVHSVSFSCADAAPTAGTIQIRDATSAGTGTVIYEEVFDTTAFRGHTVILDVAVEDGIYVDFTTTNDVNVFVSYV